METQTDRVGHSLFSCDNECICSSTRREERTVLIWNAIYSSCITYGIPSELDILEHNNNNTRSTPCIRSRSIVETGLVSLLVSQQSITTVCARKALRLGRDFDGHNNTGSSRAPDCMAEIIGNVGGDVHHPRIRVDWAAKFRIGPELET